MKYTSDEYECQGFDETEEGNVAGAMIFKTDIDSDKEIYFNDDVPFCMVQAVSRCMNDDRNEYIKVSGYENGISEHDLETFSLLVSLYNLSADYLLDIKVAKEKQPPSLSGDEAKLLSCYRALSPEQKSSLLTLIKGLAEKNRA